MRRIVLVLAALVGLIAITLVLAPGVLLQPVGNFLTVQDPMAPADAAIAISGDGKERVRTAGELLARGQARWVILSGAPAGGPGSAVELQDYAREFQVPVGRILLDETAISTYENARGSLRVMRAHGLRSAILVTSPYHMRRAVIEFRSVFGPAGLEVRAYPARDSFFVLANWWTRRRDRELVVREYLKLAAFLVGIH